MDPTEEELQKILDSLLPGEWDNPHITSWDEETRIVYTLLATQPGTRQLHYYEPDTGQFESLNLPT